MLLSKEIINKNGNKINIKNLSTHSAHKVSVKCDYCGKEKLISYSRYNINTKSETRKYACSQKCSREKSKETCFNNYGVENPSQSEEIKDKKKETCFNNYGVETPAQSNKILEKMKKTLYEKHGVENAMYSDELKNRLYETNIEIYGHKCTLCNDDVKNKRKDTWLDNYGVDHPWKSTEIRNKIYYTMVEIGYRVFDSGYTYYKKIVDSITNQIKKDFISDWNGYDFYDDEYIKENYTLDSNHKDYPTIDYKISIMSGYKTKTPPEIIGGVENLCITKRKINSQKGSKDSDNFHI